MNRKPPTTKQILAEQANQAERARGQTPNPIPPKPAPFPPGKKTDGNAVTVAVPDTRTAVQKYVDEVAPSGIVGRMIKFSKDGKFVWPDTDEEINAEDDFVALCDQILVGWIRFHDDAPPDRVMGLLYGDGFTMPDRDSLGDNNQATWSLGLDNQPQDPWIHQIYLPLQKGDTAEICTFVTSSRTGRRAVGNLLRHFDRMQKSHPDELPVIRLKTGGFAHRDERVGWVPTPTFAVVGRAPKDSVAKPDTSPGADLDDAIGF